MNAQQLKNSILQMAVSGKLVPQDPSDEPASILLERIRKEKEKLIKEGKIKKEKNPSYIFRGADNTPYEKVGNADPVSIADEVPFEIPESWEWVRLGSVIVLQSGQDMTPEKYNATGKGIPYITGASNIENGNVIINRWTEHGRAFADKGDLLLTCKGTVGKMAVLNEERVHIARQIMAIRPFSDLHVPYLQLVLETLVENLKAAAKSMIPGIAREDVLTSLLPVPPVNEQDRIVERMQALQPALIGYDRAFGTLEALNTSFPEQLKKSILQMAVQGKLVPQDPDDEPAGVLLERIREEKERLIREGKIKRDKNESVIFRRDNSHYEKLGNDERCIDDEIPFEIPETWIWIRLSSLGSIVGGGTPKTTDSLCWDGDIPWLTPADMKYVNGMYVDKGERCITDYGLHNSSAQMMPSGTILYSSRAPIGYIAIAANEICTNQGFKSLVPAIDQINQYLYYCLIERTPEIQSRASGTTFKEISGAEFGRTLIPLPPLREQLRIVKQIEAVFPIVNAL